MKTIFCPRFIGQKWLDSLRSGEYQQGKGKLQTGEGFCCLGVLEHCIEGRVEEKENEDGVLTSCGFPSMVWLEAHDIKFLDGHEVYLIPSQSPLISIKDLSCTADKANDQGISFNEIADAIEDAMEFTD